MKFGPPTKQGKLLIFTGIAVLLICTAIMVVFVANRPIAGRVAAGREIPRFAQFFPKAPNLTDIQYFYDRWQEELFAKADASEEQWKALCSEWDRWPTKYSNPKSRIDYAVPDPDYIPKGNNVYTVVLVPPEGGMMILAHFDQTEGGKDGTIYLHFIR